jgi:hypothetical protein
LFFYKKNEKSFVNKTKEKGQPLKESRVPPNASYTIFGHNSSIEEIANFDELAKALFEVQMDY